MSEDWGNDPLRGGGVEPPPAAGGDDWGNDPLRGGGLTPARAVRSGPEPVRPASRPGLLGSMGSAAAQGAVAGTGEALAGIPRALAAPARGVQAADENARALAERQFSVMDRIDRGEPVPMDQDPLGYQDASPEQRVQLRQQYTSQIEQMRAAPPTEPQQAREQVASGLENAASRVSGGAQRVAEALFPVSPEMAGRWPVRAAHFAGSTLPLAASAAVGGGPAATAAMLSQGYEGTYQSAIERGATPAQAHEAALVGSAAGAGLAELPISEAVRAAAGGLRRGGEAIAERVAAPYRAVTRAGSAQALKDTTQFVNSDQFVTDVLSGKTAASESLIGEINASRALTDSQKRTMIAAARQGAVPELRAVRDARDAAAAAEQATLQHFATAPSQGETGAQMLGRVKRTVDAWREERATTGAADYDAADTAMDARHEAGDTWQQSPAGKTFFAELEAEKQTPHGTRMLAEEETAADRLIRNLEGRRSEGSAGGLEEQSGALVLTEATPGELLPTYPSTLRRVVRKLRDAAAGYPEEGYAAIGQQRAGDLAKRLARSIEAWDSSAAEADAHYEELSRALDPARTALGKRTLRPETFDRDLPALDPNDMPRMYFKTPATVRQLVTLSGGDVPAVEQSALAHARYELAAKKTPQDARDWMTANRKWLNPETLPETYAEVNAAVTRLEQAADARKLLDDRLQAGVKRVLKERGGVRTAATAAQAGASVAERGVRADLAKARRDVQVLQERIATPGAIAPTEIPAAAKALVEARHKAGDLPRGEYERLMSELDRYSKMHDQEERTRRILKTIGLGALVAAGGYGGASLAGGSH